MTIAVSDETKNEPTTVKPKKKAAKKPTKKAKTRKTRSDKGKKNPAKEIKQTEVNAFAITADMDVVGLAAEDLEPGAPIFINKEGLVEKIKESDTPKKPYTPPDVESQEATEQDEAALQNGLSTNEVAKLCGMTVSGLNARVADGLLKPGIRKSNGQGSSAIWHKAQPALIMKANMYKELIKNITLKDCHKASELSINLLPGQMIAMSEKGVCRILPDMTVKDIQQRIGRFGYLINL